MNLFNVNVAVFDECSEVDSIEMKIGKAILPKNLNF